MEQLRFAQKQIMVIIWEPKHQNAMNRWEKYLEALTSVFKFSVEVRKVIHITNAIERLREFYQNIRSFTEKPLEMMISSGFIHFYDLY